MRTGARRPCGRFARGPRSRGPSGKQQSCPEPQHAFPQQVVPTPQVPPSFVHGSGLQEPWRKDVCPGARDAATSAIERIVGRVHALALAAVPTGSARCIASRRAAAARAAAAPASARPAAAATSPRPAAAAAGTTATGTASTSAARPAVSAAGARAAARTAPPPNRCLPSPSTHPGCPRISVKAEPPHVEVATATPSKADETPERTRMTDLPTFLLSVSGQRRSGGRHHEPSSLRTRVTTRARRARADDGEKPASVILVRSSPEAATTSG